MSDVRHKAQVHAVVRAQSRGEWLRLWGAFTRNRYQLFEQRTGKGAALSDWLQRIRDWLAGADADMEDTDQ